MENHFALQHQLQEFLYEDQLGAGAHTPNLKNALLGMIIVSLVDYVINPRKMKKTWKNIEPN